MPNHVINEVIFTNLDEKRRDEIIKVLCNENGEVDFSILLPPPLNSSWPGSVGSRHEAAFPTNHLDWCRKNWGTKWGAYSCRATEFTSDGFILRFDTAWSPPRGWLVAIFNRFKISFTYNWLSEGETRGHKCFFDWSKLDDSGEPWGEEAADDFLNRHLHVLRWKEDSDDI